MPRLSKRMKEVQKTAGDVLVPVSLQEAIARLSKAPKVKFDETVEMHFHLNLDLKASDQGVRGTVALPHGTGKSVTVAVFCKGDAAAKAQAAGADHVGGTELIEKVAGGFMDFDVVIATPDMMRDLSKLGKVLGPRGLMPTPKAGTVTTDVERTIKEVKAGRVEFKSDKQGGIHLGIGKRSFAENKLVENARHVIEALGHAKPPAVKGNLIKSLSVASTMGPGIKVTLQQL
ncbi:MAG: 50S ribosomal protein L1 [Candidatus Omnitrophica bacterium]|nr:50S ribosomal protein L1 [Candidatus Omnitrophota bacterium]